jgi:uncharacterized protein YqeY
MEEQLNADLKEAMRAGDEPRKLAIRAVKTAVTEAKVSGTQLHELTDAEVMAIIGKQIKQRRDSIAIFQTAGRQDLVTAEEAELAVLERYLPAQLDETAIRERASAVIAELGVTDVKGIGPVMKRLTTDLRGQADGQTINRIVRELLS